MTHYILAGETACNHFWNKRWRALEKSIKMNNEGRIYSFDYSQPNALSKLLDNVHGWNNFIELSNEDIKEIVSKTTIKLPISSEIKKAIYWSTNDFEAQAEHNFNELKKDCPDEFKHLENWEQLYDKSKFPSELEKMIRQHDATIGITWLTIEEYLGNCEIK
jgi:hypothetical protein